MIQKKVYICYLNLNSVFFKYYPRFSVASLLNELFLFRSLCPFHPSCALRRWDFTKPLAADLVHTEFQLNSYKNPAGSLQRST